MKRLFLIVLFALAAVGCAAPSAGSGPSYQQGVFQAKTQYSAALTAAVAYKRLPTCTATVPLPCSQPAVIAQLQKADNVAAQALDAAEVAVRTPGFGASVVSSAVAAANAAMQAFVSITTTLGTK